MVLESAFCLACCYLFYRLFLHRETFFQWNRAFLLLAPVVCLLLPALEWRWAVPPPAPAPLADQTTGDWQGMVQHVQVWPQVLVPQAAAPLGDTVIDAADVLWGIYWSGFAFVLLRLAMRCFSMFRLLRHCRRIQSEASGIKGAVLAVSDRTALPLASFFGYIFWNPGQVRKEQAEWMLTHELAHVRQWHSLDVVLMECLLAIQWFNPLMYAFRRSLCAVHEYIADDYVVRRTRQRHAYASLLVQQQTGSGASPGLFNTFHSLIKHRLIMLSKRPSRPLRRAKYLLSVPLFAALMLLFSFRFVETLPAAAPLRTLTNTTEEWIRELKGVTVVEKKLLPTLPVAFNDPQYIFYLGKYQCRLEPDPGNARRLHGTLRMDALTFAGDLTRRMYLWDGRAMVDEFSFDLHSLHHVVKKDQPEEAQKTLSGLDSWAKGVQPGQQVSIRHLSLPDGREANIALVFLDKIALEENMRKEQPGSSPFAWAGEKAEMDALTAHEFWEAIQQSPFFTNKTDNFDYIKGVEITLLPWRQDPTTYALPIARPVSESDFAKNRTVLERIKSGLVAGTAVFLDITADPTSGHHPLAYGMSWRIVDTHERGTLPNPNGLAQFRWGPVRFDLGKGVFRRYEDGKLIWDGRGKEFSMALEPAIAEQMAGSKPEIWIGDTLYARNPVFLLECDSVQYEVSQDHALYVPQYEVVRHRIRNGHQLLLRGMNAKQIGLQGLFFRFYIKGPVPPTTSPVVAEYAKPTLRIRPNPTADYTILELTLPQACTGTLTVTDAQGRIVQQDSHQWEKGSISHSLQPERWMQTPGVYVVTVSTPYGTVSESLVQR
jgi:hypothetical protein